MIQGVVEKRGQLLSQWLPRRLYLTTHGGLYSTRDLDYGGLVIRSRCVAEVDSSSTWSTAVRWREERSPTFHDARDPKRNDRRVFELKLLGQIRGKGKAAIVEGGGAGESSSCLLRPRAQAERQAKTSKCPNVRSEKSSLSISHHVVYILFLSAATTHVFALDIECPDGSHRQLALRAASERDMRRWLTCLKGVRARRLSCVDNKVAQSPSSYLSAFSGQLKLTAVDEDEENEGDVGGTGERYALPRKISDTGEFVDDCELPATTLAKQVKAAGQVSLMSMLYDSDDDDDDDDDDGAGGSGGKHGNSNGAGGGVEDRASASSIISFVAGTGATSSATSSSSKGGAEQPSVLSETKGGDDGGGRKEDASPSFSPRRSSIFDFVADLGKVARLSLGASALGRGNGGSSTDFDFGRSSMRPYV